MSWVKICGLTTHHAPDKSARYDGYWGMWLAKRDLNFSTVHGSRSDAKKPAILRHDTVSKGIRPYCSPLHQLFPGRSRADRTHRNMTIHRAHVAHGYSLSEISRVVNLHYSTISRIVSAQ